MRIYLKALLEIVTEQLLYYPCILASAVNLFLNFSAGSVLLFLSSLLAALFIHIAILLRHDKKINHELLSFLEKYPNYRFTHGDLREIINCYAAYEEIQAELYQNNLTEIGEAFTAAVSEYSGERFSGFKAFPRFFSPNVVILQEGTGNYNIFQQFQLFHELGHIGKNHKKVNVFGAHTMAGILGALLLCISIFPWYIVIALILPIRIWYFSCLGLSLIFGKEGGECEKLADSFAIKVLLKHPDFEKLERILMRINVKSAERWQESLDYYKQWFQNPVNMQKGRMFLSRYAGNEKLKFAVNRGLSDEAVNYNSMVEWQCFPRNYFSAYVLCGLLAAGTAIRHVIGWRFWILLIFPLVTSFLFLCVNLKQTCTLSVMVHRFILDGNSQNNQPMMQDEKDEGNSFQKMKANIARLLMADKKNRAFTSKSGKK